jgi:predicted unusual protein kinase regulating ubiquinone biosynthesis (AarF/ABC1/UbiB family)
MVFLSIYLIIKRKDSFLGLKSLTPKKLGSSIERLGASFVKLAQVLATRADFFPPSYLEVLKNLHDALPPMKKSDFDYVFNFAFKPETFKYFEEKPIASATIGQVHIAKLHSGEKVAVKLRRKGIKSQVLADIRILSIFNTLFRPLFSRHTKHSIEAVISEFSTMIRQEVSLSNELANLEKFRSIYADSGVKFPLPYPRYSCDDALVMSFEDGFRFDDKEAMLRHKIDFKPLIQTLVNFYVEQMLIQGFFHADPHPGNIFITTKGEVVLLDFGMVKTVPNTTRVAIIELLQAANSQDYELYISASKRLGTVAYEAPTAELAEFTAKMFAIFSNDNLTNESMQELAFEVLESTRNLPFKLPSDAIYILRVSAIIEGLGTTYIPNFNGVKDILPLLIQELPRALGAKSSIIETFIDEAKALPFVVSDIKHAMKRLSSGSIQTELSNDQLAWAANQVRKFAKGALLGLALVIGGSALFLAKESWEFYGLFLFGFGIIQLISL